MGCNEHFQKYLKENQAEVQRIVKAYNNLTENEKQSPEGLALSRQLNGYRQQAADAVYFDGLVEAKLERENSRRENWLVYSR